MLARLLPTTVLSRLLAIIVGGGDGMVGAGGSTSEWTSNALELEWPRDVRVRVVAIGGRGRRARGGRGALAWRRGRQTLLVPLDEGAAAEGEAREEVPDAALVARLLRAWLARRLAEMGRAVEERGAALLVVSRRAEDELLRQVMPDGRGVEGVELRAAYSLEVRVLRSGGRERVLLLVDAVTQPVLAARAAELAAAGVELRGLRARRVGSRERGRILRVEDGEVVLGAARGGEVRVPAGAVELEPRLDALARVLQARGAGGEAAFALLRRASALVVVGDRRLARISRMAGWLAREEVRLAPGLVGRLGSPLPLGELAREAEVLEAPARVLGGGAVAERLRAAWNRDGPLRPPPGAGAPLRLAVVWRPKHRALAERFARELIRGSGADAGLVRLCGFDDALVGVFPARGDGAEEWRAAARAAADRLAAREGPALVLVQTERAPPGRPGPASYRATRALLQARGVPVQHVAWQTMAQPPRQLPWTLQNVRLACVARLGGLPWRVDGAPEDAEVVVLALARGEPPGARRGAVGVVTAWRGDGGFLFAARTDVVRRSRAAEAAIARADEILGERPAPSALLVLAPPPSGPDEVRRALALADRLGVPERFAFVEVGSRHPFRLYDPRVPGLGWARKGPAAPPRGLWARLSGRDSLLLLKGAAQLATAVDGHPAPLLLRFHRRSTWREPARIARLLLGLSAAWWRGFQPSGLPAPLAAARLVAAHVAELAGQPEGLDAIPAHSERPWFL